MNYNCPYMQLKGLQYEHMQTFRTARKGPTPTPPPSCVRPAPLTVRPAWAPATCAPAAQEVATSSSTRESAGPTAQSKHSSNPIIFKFRAFSRRFYPKRPTIRTFVRRNRNNNLSQLVQYGCSWNQGPSTTNR